MIEALGNTCKTFETSACKIAKVEVAGSNPVSRSKYFRGLDKLSSPFFSFLSTVHPFLHPFDFG